MNKFFVFVAAVIISYSVPMSGLAAGLKTVSGTVTSIANGQIMMSTVSAAKYSAELSSAVLTRKNGASMQFSEILVSDKVTITGTLWADNSISAVSLRDNSLYAHSGTFTGKITGINPPDASFVIQSKTYGTQTIQTNNFTSYSKNGANSGFQDLQLGMTATVKGVWDRSNANITASNIIGTFRMIDIYFVGTLSAKNGASLTVIGNGNVIYGVDVSQAKILNKNGKAVPLTQYISGDTLRVWGKHISGMVAVTGTEIKDMDIGK